MQDDQTVVQLESATFFNESHPTVQGFTVAVKRREFLSVIGKSGSGKTTLLRGIAGLIPSTGRVARFGRMRMVFQQDRLLPWLTVHQNVALGLVGNDLAHADVDSVLYEVGLADLGNRYIWQLSGGERQRAASARAFVSNPDLVLMDEPFGSLDVLTREKMQDWLMEYWARHTVAILFITHDIEEALMMSDRILIIRQGKLVGETIVPFERKRDAALRFAEQFVRMRRELHQQLLGTDTK